MTIYNSPYDILNEKKPRRISFRASDNLLEIIVLNPQVKKFIDLYYSLNRKGPSEDDIMRFALCVFAFNINQDLDKNEESISEAPPT